MTLATVGLDGSPQARTVVLRAFDRPAGSLHIYTDVRSAKVAELRASPHAAIHVCDGSVHLQLRLLADVAVLTGPDVAALWTRVPQGARTAYGSMPAPGLPAPGRPIPRRWPTNKPATRHRLSCCA